MAEPGMIMTAKEASDYLRKNTTNLYKPLDIFGKAAVASDIGFQQQENLALREYGTDVANAYETALLQKSQIAASNLGEGYKSTMIDETETVLENAYNAYLTQYMANKQTIGQSKASVFGELAQGESEYIAGVENMLQSDAANYAALYNMPMDYLQYLVNENIIDATNPEYSKYFKTTYVGGQPTTSLQDREWFEKNLWEDGKLTALGEDFYSQMLYGNKEYSFNDYLYATNPQLYNWAFSENPYDTGFLNEAGQRTFFADVFGQGGVPASVLTKGTYQGGVDWDVKPESSYVSKDVGTVDRYTTPAGKTLDNLTGFTLNNLNVTDAVGGKSESFSATYVDSTGTERLYRMKTVKDAEVSDDILNDIISAVGTLQEGKLYAYGGDTNRLFVALEGKLVPVILTGKTKSEDFWTMLNNPPQ